MSWRPATTTKLLLGTLAIFLTAGCGGEFTGDSHQALSMQSPTRAKSFGPGPLPQGMADSFPEFTQPKSESEALLKLGPVSGTTARPLLQKASNGSFGAWLLDKSGQLAASTSLSAAVNVDWEVKGTGDFDRDGQPDILWQHKTKRTLVVWLMNGTSYLRSIGLPTAASGWTLSAVADFDGDGSPDLLWRNVATGQISFWKMQGTTVSSAVGVGIAPSTGGPWKICAAADFFQDRCADIVWQSEANQSLKVWKWSGVAQAGEVSWSAPPLGFALRGADDFNSDGQADLLLENRSTSEIGFLPVRDGAPAAYTKIGTGNSSRVLVGVLPPAAPAVKRSAVDGYFSQAVFDVRRNRLYCTNAYLNRVEVYDAATKTLLSPIEVGSQPQGIDISADGSKLIVCASGTSFIYLVDLASATPVVTSIPLPRTQYLALRLPFYAVCTSNNRAVISSQNENFMLEFDFTTQSFREISEYFSGVRYLAASPDKSTIVATETLVSSCFAQKYSPSTGQFSPYITIPRSISSASVRNDGTTLFNEFVINPLGQILGRQPTFTAANRSPNWSCFNSDASRTIASYYKEVVVLDSKNYQVCARLTLPADVNFIVAGATPNRYFAISGAEVLDIDLTDNLAPVVEPMEALKVPIGKTYTTKLIAKDPEGRSIQWSAEGLPNDASLNTQSGELTFAPVGGDSRRCFNGHPDR